MINPTPDLAATVLIASGATFVFIILEKRRVIELFQLYRSRILPTWARSLPDCNFCMLFWLCLLVSIPIALISNIFYIALAPFAAPIAKAIYENSRATR